MMVQVQLLTTPDDDSVAQITKLVKELSSAANDEYTRDAIESASNQILIARADDGKIVGTATMVMVPCLSGRRVHIEDVVVTKDYQKQGIATMLLKEAVERAKKEGARTIDMTSRPEREAANALYNKLGFIQRDTNVYRYSEK
ncbi:hypothetical protein EC973_008851 [Apophysomyces ossiformis]|uniref:N-acetyltransferase domain-containing protein n=1 Tax=Apophysomyces ossiformis TaxID=679940 RepID=A0A8H7ET66_9FUNG|nr:hypothetical protein EC973_008851 [Apophysomyces ossiformis]